MTPSVPPNASNYLLFSDVHLGADLVQHTRPWTASRLREALRIDHDLGGLLDYYRVHSDPARPWRLVIAGDFIDFIGMSISPNQEASLEAPLTEDELAHGLGSTHDQAAVKMRAVAQRHDLLFRRLAAFVQAGHMLVFVRGNHDVELYWESAQRAFLDALSARAELPADDAIARKVFESRVEFRHWFYYVRGFLYVEHGHQYDATCAYHNVLAPRSPSDPKRISYSFSDILLRYVVRPTRELSTEGHENKSIFNYLHLAYTMGVKGGGMLGYRYFRSVGRMVRAWREQLSDRAAHVRAEHEQSMQQIASSFRVSIDNLRAITKLWATPITGKLVTIFRSVFLDGLAAAFVSGIALTTLGALDVLPIAWLPLIMACVMFGIGVYMKSCVVTEPHDALRRGAEKLAELMPARYIVMGHTHRPVMEPLPHDSTYVNLGNWTADLLDDHAPASPCTYLVVEHDAAGRAAATLCAWSPESGPRVLHSDAAEPARSTDGSGAHAKLEGPDSQPSDPADGSSAAGRRLAS
jgi:UDP-2,3-diacylglucosamine pyrophosphatase LpxH